MNRRCDRCEFWHGPQLATNSNYGECRRNPPQRASSGLGGWPNTRPEQWCGEFRLHQDVQLREAQEMAREMEACRVSVADALNKHRKDWPTP